MYSIIWLNYEGSYACKSLEFGHLTVQNFKNVTYIAIASYNLSNLKMIFHGKTDFYHSTIKTKTV